MVIIQLNQSDWKKLKILRLKALQLDDFDT